MHPDLETIALTLPPLPTLDLEVEGQQSQAEPVVQSIAVRPDQMSVTISYALRVDMGRVFIPEVHRHIPLAFSLGGERHAYQAPPTLYDRFGKFGVFGI